MKIIVFVLLFFSTSQAHAKWYYNVSVLSSETNYNYFSIPSDNEQNRFDIDRTTNANSYRLLIEKKYSNWSLTFLYAPLTINYNQQSASAFRFNNTTFAANRSTDIEYKFNSYRIGYRRNHQRGKSRFYYGGLIKIRDAKICVSQNSLSDCYDNIGPVPLLNIGAELYGKVFFSKFNIDGLYSSRGSAYDANIETGIDLHYFDLSLGFRILGGGAQNEKVTNFAQFRSWYLGITI